jgi:hypothetical protein
MSIPDLTGGRPPELQILDDAVDRRSQGRDDQDQRRHEARLALRRIQRARLASRSISRSSSALDIGAMPVAIAIAKHSSW